MTSAMTMTMTHTETKTKTMTKGKMLIRPIICYIFNKLAKLQATLVRNYDSPTDRLADRGEV